MSNITLKSVERKESNSKNEKAGVVIHVVEVESYENKREIMKNKRNLRSNRKYKDVYIENDSPIETRNFQATVRTVFKEIVTKNSYRFPGNRLIKNE